MARSARRTQAERRQEAVANILDTAEAVFAAHGFNGTTLNEVAASAGVDTGLVRYYFSDKDRLFDAVLERRAPHINAVRLEALAAYEAALGDAMTLEGIIDAFVRPAFTVLVEDEGWRNFAAIIAYVSSSRSARRQVMSVNFDAVSHRVIGLMARALPHADREEIYWGYHFLTGAFTYSLGQTGRIDVLSDGTVSGLDFAAMSDRLVLTLAAGIRGLCARAPHVSAADEVAKRVAAPTQVAYGQNK